MHLYELEDPEVVETDAQPAEVVADPVEPVAVVAESPGFYDLVAQNVWNDDDPVSDDALKAYTADSIKALPPEARMALAGIIKLDKERTAAIEAERAKLAEERAADAAARADAEADIKRRELAYSQAVADPAVIDGLRKKVAAKPAVVNPNDPASIEALIDAKAAEKVLEAMGPAAAKHDTLAKANAADTAFASAGLSRANKEDLSAVNAKMFEVFGREGMTSDEWKAHVATLSNAARASGSKSPTQIAVAMVAAERKARADAAARADETQARMAGARSLATSTPRRASEPTDQEVVDSVIKSSEDPAAAFAAAWDSNPKFREAAMRLQAH